MKDIRIFVASSKELLSERNALVYFVPAVDDELAVDRDAFADAVLNLSDGRVQPVSFARP